MAREDADVAKTGARTRNNARVEAGNPAKPAQPARIARRARRNRARDDPMTNNRWNSDVRNSSAQVRRDSSASNSKDNSSNNERVNNVQSNSGNSRSARVRNATVVSASNVGSSNGNVSPRTSSVAHRELKSNVVANNSNKSSANV